MEKSYVTMEQKMCPVCGKTFDSGAILMDRQLKPKFDMKTTTGYGLCEEHQKLKDEGYIFLIACDKEKTNATDGKIKMEEAYRTGEIASLKREVFKRLFGEIGEGLDFVFVEEEVIAKLKEMENKK